MTRTTNNATRFSVNSLQIATVLARYRLDCSTTKQPNIRWNEKFFFRKYRNNFVTIRIALCRFEYLLNILISWHTVTNNIYWFWMVEKKNRTIYVPTCMPYGAFGMASSTEKKNKTSITKEMAFITRHKMDLAIELDRKQCPTPHSISMRQMQTFVNSIKPYHVRFNF